MKKDPTPGLPVESQLLAMAKAADSGSTSWLTNEELGYADPEKGNIIHIDPEKGYEPVVELKELHSVIREGICLGGGLTALILQIAHPAVGRGVGNHSEFMKRAVNRAENTAIYIFAMVFGKPHEKEAVRSFVNKMHASINGGVGASAYNAKDPETQLWVAATIYVSMIGMYEIVYGPLEPAKAERVYQEFSILGTSLQMPPGLWPISRAAFNEYYEDMVQNHLRVTPEARNVMHDLMHPYKAVPFIFRPAVPFVMLVVKAMTVEQLPTKVREEFGLRSTWFSRSLNSLVMAVLISLYPMMPLFVRQSPKTFYMWRMRRRLKKRGIMATKVESSKERPFSGHVPKVERKQMVKT